MTPTLADVFMLTGLKITGLVSPYDFTSKGIEKLEDMRGCRGWPAYIRKYMSINSVVSLREHVSFITMWLERFIFCGSSYGPTTNHQLLAERLIAGDDIPLGKYLLGSVYSLMRQVSAHLQRNEPIGAIGGPWWFIQLWLHLYLHRFVTPHLQDLKFPSLMTVDENKEETCCCLSYGEAASVISIDFEIAYLFQCFYKGFPKEVTVWLPYDGEDYYFELPCGFRFDTFCLDEPSSAIFDSMVKPALLPVDFRHGRGILPT